MTANFGLALCSAADAGVNETNYQQIDPEFAIIVDGFFSHSQLRRGPHVKGDLTLGTHVVVRNGQEIGIRAGAGDFSSIAILSEKDLCAFGARVKLDRGAVSNSIEVTFKFIHRNGEMIDQEVRFPAVGTTRQSFSSESYLSRFAGIEVHAKKGSRLEIGDIRVLPCAISIS